MRIESIHYLNSWIYCCFFSFLSSPENQYMNHQVQNLLYDTGNILIELNKKKITSFSLMFLNHLNISNEMT